MEASFKIDSNEIKTAIIGAIKEKLGMDVLPAEASLYIKFDDATKSVSNATLTVKKD